MKIIKRISILCLCLSGMIMSSCSDDYGANPFDNSPFTVSKLPKVLSFEPTEGKAGTEVTIIGINFSTATDVAFDGKKAESFEIIDDTTIKAIVSDKTTTGVISVTNEKGTRASKEKFTFIKEASDDTPLNVNLAEGKSVTVSTNEAANFHITNGKYENAWQVIDAGANPLAEGWFIIDLGDTYTFDNMVTAWDMGAYATDYELLISENGENYTSISHTTDWTTTDTESAGIFNVGKQDIKLASPVKARYVKGIVKVSNSPWAMTVCEVEIYKRNATNVDDDTPYDENLAVSKGVTVSTNEAANFHITNGKYENAWQVVEGVTPLTEGWFIVDLGDIVSFNNIVTAWDMGAYATDYELLISEDGDNYTTISHTTDWTTTETETSGIFNVGKQETKLDNLVKARYIKGILKKCNSQWAMTVCEIEVYKRKAGSGDTPTVPEDNTPMNTNLALEKTVTASSEFYPASNAVLGKFDFYWVANAVGNQWLKIDLGKEYTINNIDIYWGVLNYCKTTEILVSLDDNTYTSVCTSAEWTPTEESGYEKQSITFENTKTRYVKANFIEGTLYALWCYEFEVYKR